MLSQRVHSPVRQGARESRTATEAIADLRGRNVIAEVSGEAFLATYLTGAASGQTWTDEQQQLVNRIRTSQDSGGETLLCTDSAPLLRLLNFVSLQIAGSEKALRTPPEKFVLVFRTRQGSPVPHPFNKNSLCPDIVVQWGTREDLKGLVSLRGIHDFTSLSKSWSDLVAVGEVKLRSDPSFQLANCLQNLLQLRPEQNAVLGLSVKPSGYRLFYHDASVIHRSEVFRWTPGPLYAFIEKLYKRDFRDHSLAVLSTNGGSDRAYAVAIESHRFISLGVRPEPGPGQRRFIAILLDVYNGSRRFQKDSWRDFRRRFFEGLMYAKAHDGTHIPGLMTILFYGYVLDSSRKRLETTVLQPEAGRRAKTRLISGDIGQPLENIESLSHFLRVMYDACVADAQEVQRNLYRKCRILHRDISDNNIMVAPTDPEFKKHCDGEYYDSVKYINQILAKDGNVKPEPACLVVDLGNGADLKQIDDNQEARGERTGTPKFIARSVSLGEPLSSHTHPTDRLTMPILEGRALELYKPSNEAEYTKYTDAVQNHAGIDVTSGIEHKHQLFHDAESTFWVVAWTLARSAPTGYEEEKQWPPALHRFVMAMEMHQPGPLVLDGRDGAVQGLSAWEGVLHPSLASVAPMLTRMHRYIYPEWQYRPELDVEHVHEALMRLLLTEIVRLEDSGADVGLVVGGRALPTISGSKSSQGSAHSSSIYPLVGMLPDAAPQATIDLTKGGSQPNDTGESQPQRPRGSPRALVLESMDNVPELIAKVEEYPWSTDYHLETPQVN
ncbi:hypothetical protein FRC06_005209 [Ceratobasidium sp. 370]|nr:hypothetical protein FRC06_005209 [Ceratobasidium sp. 370]